MTKFHLVGVLVAVFVACAGMAAAATSMSFTPIGMSNGWAINAAGQVAGYGGIPSQAFFYSAGTATNLNLGGLDGNPSSIGGAFGINNSGTVVGYAVNSTLANGTRAMVTSGGLMTDLDAYDPTLGQSRAYGANSSGAVVSGYYTNSQWNALTYHYSGNYNATTAVYSGGTWSYTDINSLFGAATGAGNGGGSEALAINGAGTITGFATALSGMGIAWNSQPQAFVLNSAGAVTILPAPSGMDSTAGEAINAKGDVAGNTWSSGNSGSYAPYLAVNGPGGYTGIDLGVPAGYGNTYGYGLNDYDMVVGTAQGGSGGAFLWTTGVVPFYGLSLGVNDLNAVAAKALPSGWVMTNARSINDSGQITGVATYTSDGTRAAKPHPLAAAGVARRRQPRRQGGCQRPDDRAVEFRPDRGHDLGHWRLQRRRSSGRQRPDNRPVALRRERRYVRRSQCFGRARAGQFVAAGAGGASPFVVGGGTSILGSTLLKPTRFGWHVPEHQATGAASPPSHALRSSGRATRVFRAAKRPRQGSLGGTSLSLRRRA